jgi:HupE / UreJ protein
MRVMTRTRHMPGSLLLVAVTLVAAGAVLEAHDPGLSSLDVAIGAEQATASLALSAVDVALVAPSGDTRAALGELARTGVRLSIDGVRLPAAIGGIAFDRGAARVAMSFAMPSSSARSRRVEIASDVPGHVARGHRELLVVRANDRAVIETLLDAHTGPVTVDVDAPTPSILQIARHYVELGVHHILTGYDHLVFLAGLILAARTGRELLIALTAFTAAHSVSLALVVVGGVHAPPSIVEPLIAASIAWVGLESLIFGRRGARWIVVFGFGLVHGFGFAGALIDLGLGTSAAAIATALISFNAGVEAGQLAVAGMLLPIVSLLRSRPQWHARLAPACALLITAAGTYWLIERLR